MRTWCGRSCLFELTLVLAWVMGTASRVIRAREGIDDAASLSALFQITVFGYRGSAGTIGVLTAAAIVIPAGVVSIAYLLYVYNCKRDNDNSDEEISREWSWASTGNLGVANGLWAQADEVHSDTPTSFLLGSALDPGSTGDMEKLSLISWEASTASMTDGGSFAVNWQDGTWIMTPERETRVDAGKVMGAAGNGNLANMVEVHVTAEDASEDLNGNIVEFPEGGKIANTGDFRQSVPVHADAPMSGKPTSCFTEVVHMNAMNQVHVELRLTNGKELQSKNDNEENYTSEVKLYIPGIGEGPADSGRPFRVDVNNTAWF